MSGAKSLAPALRRTLGDDVADRLREAILRGEFAAGEHLREEELAAMLQVSRGPVRDAFGALERDGLVVLSRHRGATVVQLSRDDLDEVYSLRIALEALAARYVVRRAEPDDLARLDAALAEFVAALSGHPSEHEAAQLDVAFHDAVYQAARHQRLYASWTSIRLQVYRFLLFRNLANPDWRENTATGHADIVGALRSGDEEAAVDVVAKHIQYAHARVLEGFSPGEGAGELVAAPSRVERPTLRPASKTKTKTKTKRKP